MEIHSTIFLLLYVFEIFIIYFLLCHFKTYIVTFSECRSLALSTFKSYNHYHYLPPEVLLFF